MQVKGQWRPEWAPVVDTFAANFERGEQGAALAIYRHGEAVVDIWAGARSNRLAAVEAEPWAADTLVNVFSAGKGLVAICVLQLLAEGKLALDVPVADYWPEFAAQGKQAITLRQLLSHRSGLSAFNQRIADTQIFDWSAMTAAVTQESPWWEPGQKQGYSPFMYGWILGELVRRVSGYASFGAYFRAKVAEPVGAECYFGVPGSIHDSIADTGPLKRPLGSPASSTGADSVALGKLMKADPRGVTNRAFSNPITLMTATNSREWRSAEIPAANAHANASALAAIYGDLALPQPSLLSSDLRSMCWQEQTFAQDQVLGLPLRFSLGFMLSQAERSDCRYGHGKNGFGHPGAGGSLGFADPDYQLGFGYVTARMGQGILIDDRAAALITAAYGVMGGNHE